MAHFRWQLDQDSTQGVEQAVRTVRFGDGYEQAISIGINNNRTKWQCKKTDTKAVIDEIYRFLLDTQGVTPFTIAPIPTEPNINARLDGEINRQQVGGEIWSISFNIKQVF